MAFDPQQILALIRRRWWLLLLGPLIAGAVAYSISSRQTPQYAATTTLLINPPAAEGGLNYDAVMASQNLAQTYQELVTIQPVLTDVIGELRLPYTVDELRSRVSAATRQNSQILKVSVTDTDAGRTAQIANSIAHHLQEYIATNANIEIVVADPAVTPTAPFAPRVPFVTLVGVIAGLLVVAGAAILLEYLDDTVKIDTNFPALGAGALLAGIGTTRRLGRGPAQLFILEQPAGKPAEAIRLLRTRVQFAAATRKPLILAVTSADAGDGKSTLAANLGVALAQTGASTLIVDANLRDPSQHRIFEAGNERGLTTLLAYPDLPWREAAIAAGPGLLLIPSGPATVSPADLLGQGGLPELLAQVGQTVDYVVIDTPSLLTVSDGLVVASAADGVILVCRAGRTEANELRQAAAMLRQHGIWPAGVVVNRQSGRDAERYRFTTEEGMLALPMTPGQINGADVMKRRESRGTATP